MKTGKAPYRILAMALAVTVFATSTSLTTLAEKGEGYDGTGAVQTLSEAMPEMDYGSPTSEISSESQTESSAEIIGGGGDASHENPPVDETTGNQDVPSEPQVPGEKPGQSENPEEKPDGSVSPEEKPDGSVSPEEKPDGSENPEEKPDESENPEENLDGVENPDELLEEELLEEDLSEPEEEVSGYLLCGKIYEDRNGNGQQDEDEIGLPDIEVSVYKGDTYEPVGSVMTDSDGRYELEGLEEGSYTLEIIDDEWLDFYYDIERTVAEFPGTAEILGEGDTFALRILNVEADEEGKEEELELGFYAWDELMLDAMEEIKVNGNIESKVMTYKDAKVGRQQNDNPKLGYHTKKTEQGSNIRLFCMQLGEHDKGAHTPEVGGIPDRVGTAKQRRKCELAAYYSEYYPGWGKLTQEEKDRYHFAAQAIIWETMGYGKITFYYNKNNAPNKLVKYWTKIDISKERKAIENKIEAHSTKPSFNKKTFEIWKDGSGQNQTLTIKDENKVLKGYEVGMQAGYLKNVKIDGNKLLVTIDKNAPVGSTSTIQLQRYDAKTGDPRNVYYASSTLQDLMKYGHPEVIATVTIQYKGKGTVRVRKVDDAGQPVAGVTFRYGFFKNLQGQPVNTIGGSTYSTTAPTDANGYTTIVIEGDSCNVHIQELSVPAHLEKDTTTKTVSMVCGKTTDVVFTNKRMFFVALEKTDAETGAPIPGVTFEYWNKAAPGNKYTAVTDAKGQFTSKVRFPVGTTVVMEEKSIAGVLGTYYPAPVKPGSVQEKVITPTDYTFIFTNTIDKRPVRIRKLSADDSSVCIPKVSFKIGPNLDGVEGDLLNGYKIYKTDANGEIVTDDFRVDQTIYYQEIQAADSPKWVKIDPTRYTASGTGYIIIRNEEEPVPLRVKKQGSDGRPLAGVTFRLEYKNPKNGNWEYQGSLTTNSKGEAVSAKKFKRGDIAAGRVRLIETSLGGLKGYTMPTNTTFVVSISNPGQITDAIEYTVVNPKIPTMLTIHKYDEDNAEKLLDGAVFRITDERGNFVQELTTRNGVAQTQELLADTVYYIEEVTPPRGYELCGSFAKGKKQRFVITEQGHVFTAEGKEIAEGMDYNYSFEVSNKPVYGWIKIYKKDDKFKPLENFEFTIYKDGKVVDTLKTDENGYAESKPLVADGSYTILETNRPPQYMNNHARPVPIDFIYQKDGEWYEGDWHCLYNSESKIMTYRVTNYELLGSITIHKVDSEDRTVPVEGAEFVIRNRITGEQIGTSKKTDKNGYATFTDLPLVTEPYSNLKEQGHYEIEEITAGKNHILPQNKKRQIDLNPNSDGTGRDITVTFENPPYKGTIEIKKVDREDSAKTLAGAEFAVYEAAAYEAAVKAGKTPTAVAEKTTGANGIASFTNLRYGTYIIKETKAPLYYYIDEATGGNSTYWDKSVKGYRVTIRDNGEVIPLTITNSKMYVKVQVTKKGYANRPLSNVTFHICKADGTYVGELTTNSAGIGYSKEYVAEELGEGAYIKEVGEVPGYEPYIKHHVIQLRTNMTQRVQLVSETVKNELTPKEVKFRKINELGEGVNAQFLIEAEVYDDRPGKYVTISSSQISLSKKNNVYDLKGLIEQINSIAEQISPDYKPVYINFTEISTESHYIHAANRWQLVYWPYTQTFSGNSSEFYSFDQDTLTITCVNKVTPIELTIKKVNQYNASTKGAVFSIIPELTPVGIPNSEIIVDMKELSECTVTLPWAECYVIREIKTPDGYAIPEFQMRSMRIDRSEFTKIKDSQQNIIGLTTEISWINYKIMPIKIKKVGPNGEPLDATFRISQAGKEKSTVEVKAENGGAGLIDLTNIELYGRGYCQGSLNVEEISVDSNYILLNNLFEIQVDTSLSEPVKIINPPSGVTGKLEYINGEYIFVITITDQKKSTDFYMKKKGAGTDSVNANITLEAYVRGSWNGSGSYQISNGPGNGTNINQVMTPLESLPYGCDIYITETSASEGYKKHPRFKAFTYYPDKEGLEKFQDVSEYITITPSIGSTKNTFTITLQNVPEDPIYLTLSKREWNDPGKELAGAVFEVVPKGKPAIELVTTGKTNGTTISLPVAESYTVTEKRAPEGYVIEGGESYVYTMDDFARITAADGSVSYLLTLRFDNRKVQGRIRIEKYDQGQPDNQALAAKMAGAQFGIYKWNGSGKMVIPGIDKTAYEKVKSQNGYTLVDTVTISADGTGTSRDLPYNTDGYVILETKAPTGYELSYELQVRAITEDGVTVEARYGDQRKKGSLSIHKEDEETNAPLASARFRIYDADTGKAVGEEWITGPDGNIGPVELPYGRYYIKETAPPSGYVKVSGDWEAAFTLDDSHPAHEAIVPNRKTEYAFRLIKTDGEGNYLAGAEFGLYEAGSPSPHEDASAEAIHTFRTGISGAAIVPLEKAGDYDIYELKAPDGYELLTEKWEIHVDEGMPTAEVGPIVNNRYPMTLKILKTDEGGQPLAGAVFEIKDKETGASVAITGETDENGEVTVELPAGYITYTAMELKAPEGYVLDDTPRDVTVSKVSDAETGEETFLAEPLTVENKKQTPSTGTIRLVKTEEGKPDKPLEGAVYGIYPEGADQGGEPVYTLTTNSLGEAEVSELPYGTYTVKELTPPAGYGWDKASPHTAVLSGDTPVVTLQAEDPLLLGGFRVRKADGAKAGLYLEGAEFAVFTDRESAEDYNAEEPGGIVPKDVQPTGADGIAAFEGLPYGTYYVKEIKAPKGYERMDTVEKVVVDENSLMEGPPALEFPNYPEKGSLRVIKRDKDSGETLKGAEFKVEKLEEDGTVSDLGTHSTDEKGSFLMEGLECGMYRITETKAPEGYRLSAPATQTVGVTPDSWNDPVRVDFADERIETSISIYKIDGETKKPLAGALFNIYKANEDGYPVGEAVTSLYTGEDGKAESIKLPLGKYVLQEVLTPDSYTLDMSKSDDFTFEVTKEEDENIEKTITNTPLKGELRIEKRDEETGEGLNGVKFTVYRHDDTEYADLVTDTVDGQDGVATLEGIPYGIYYVKETGVPEGYVNQDFYEVFWIGDGNGSGGAQEQESVVLQVSNTRGKGHISLVKVDEDDGNTGVGGAVYGIYTAMEDGDVKADSLLEDNRLVTNPDKTPAVSKELPWGTYYVKEVSSPAGYEKNDEIYIAELGEMQTMVEIQAQDKKETGIARIRKEDGNGQPVEGAVFALYTKDQYDRLQQGGDVLGIYPVTDAAGYASCENLRLGETYVVVEHVAPAGYALDEDFIEEFTPTAEEREFAFTCVNHRIDEIIIRKVDEDLEPLTVAIFHLYSCGPDEEPGTEDDSYIGEFGNSDNDDGIARYPTAGLPNGWYYVKETRAPLGGYQLSHEIRVFELTDGQRGYDEPEKPFINKGYEAELEIWKQDEKKKPMSGAVFTLYEQEAVWDDETDGWAMNLINPRKVELDGEGHAHVTGLKANKTYTLVETTVPEGYKKAEDIHIDFVGMGQLKTEDGRNWYYYGETIVNYPVKGKIKVRKEVENPTGIETEVNLEGAVFEIRDENNKVLDTLTTDKDGIALSNVELPYGRYQVVETKAPAGTELNSTPGEVEIDGGMEDDIYQYTHVNQAATGKIKIIKTDDGEPAKRLAGAEFDLIRKEGNVTAAHLETDENGEAQSGELPLGEYLVRETKAPLGHTFGEVTELEAVISEGEQTVELTFTNPEGDGTGLLVQKYDRDDPTKALAGAKFDLYRKADSAEANDASAIDEPEGENADGASATGVSEREDADANTANAADETEGTNAGAANGTATIRNANTPEDIEAALEGAVLQAAGVTDADGRIRFFDLEKGEYILVEREAPEGYRAEKHIWDISLDAEETIVISVPNGKPKGRIHFTKTGDIFAGVEENPTVAYPEQKVLKWKEAEIAGAEIEIYTTGEVKWNGKTYQEGEVITTVKSGETSSYLPVGDYEYQEKSAPSPYILDTERYPITVVEEEAAEPPEGEEGTPAQAELSNIHGEVELKLEKAFEDGAYLDKGTLAAQYEKVKFGIYTEGCLYVADAEEPAVEPNTLIGVFGVDEDGRAMDASFRLPEGEYYVKELATAEGYRLDDTEYKFQVAYGNEKAEITLPGNGEPVINERKDGMLVVHKRGAAFANVETVSAFGKWAVNMPVFTEMGIAGAEIEVYATEETRIGDKVYQAGELIDTLISGEDTEENPSASISLPFGTYLLKEVKAPEGYILEEKEIEVVLQPEEPGQEVVLEEYSFINRKATVTPELHKKFFGLTDEEAASLYAQVVFGVYAAEDIRGNTDSAVLRENMLVYLIQPGEDGENHSEDYLPAGKYYIKELATAEGYAVDEKRYYFTVEPDSRGLLAVTEKPEVAGSDETETGGTGSEGLEEGGTAQGKVILNYPEGNRIPFSFRKVDAHGRGLPGAVFRLYLCMEEHEHIQIAGEGSCFKEIEGLSPVTGGEDGMVYFGELPQGSYQLEEVQAPEGYECPKGQWYIRIDPEAESPITIQAREKDGEVPPAFMTVEQNGQSGWEYRLLNYKKQELPMAGGTGTIPYVGGGGVLLSMAGLLWKKRRKEDEPE